MWKYDGGRTALASVDVDNLWQRWHIIAVGEIAWSLAKALSDLKKVCEGIPRPDQGIADF